MNISRRFAASAIRAQTVKRAGSAVLLSRRDETTAEPSWPAEYHAENACLGSSAFDEFMSRGRNASSCSMLCHSSAKAPPVVRTKLAGPALNVRTLKATEPGQAIHLYEFQDSGQLQRFLLKVCPQFQSRVYPVSSRVLKHTSFNGYRDVHLLPKLTFDFESVDNEALTKDLLNASSLDQQILLLYCKTRISENGLRLRFFLTSLVEDVVRLLFPNAVCRPFGSTVNGFAQKGCDLDVNVQLSPGAQITDKMPTADQFFYCAKYRPHNERAYVQTTLAALGAVLDTFVPGVVGVSKILNARVPIVKLEHAALGISCDLTLDNRFSFKTAKVLWTMCRLQPCLRPLLFTVRRWARQMGLTHAHPGCWLSNFQLICLVVAFLQCRQPALLPPMASVANAKFLRDKWQPSDASQPPALHQLLIEFFHFFGTHFDSENRALCLASAESIAKSDFAPLVVWNPFEQGHNIAKNVSSEEWLRCLKLMRVAESILRDSHASRLPLSDKNWGLLCLFDKTLYPDDIKIALNANPSPPVTNVAEQILSATDRLDACQSGAP